MSIEVIRYNSTYKSKWDDVVEKMRNATFLHFRDFMDYHADRFEDASLLFEKSNRIIGVWPANYCAKTNTIYSHQGLTYGGLLLSAKANYADVKAMMEGLVAYYKRTYPQLRQIILKPTPYIYHTGGSDELLYWLYQNGATLQSRGLSSCIPLREDTPAYSTLRKRHLKKALQQPWQIRALQSHSSKDLVYLANYWALLTQTLSVQHGVTPVHSLEEIQSLWQTFPNNIRVAIVQHHDTSEVVAGAVVFDTSVVRHVQYIANGVLGRANGALELLFDHEIRDAVKKYAYFDFGVSTEQGGSVLNEGLLFQKEGFGARGVCYDVYKMKV